MGFNERMPRIDPSRFSMVPRPEVPRSTFVTTHTHKTTFDAGFLVPILVEEVLPGDVHQGTLTIFARLATPLFPIMDHMALETFFFFVPNRLVWANWRKFMGEQTNPGDSISFTIPQNVSAAGGFPVGSVMDYMGLPTVGQVGGGNTITASALPIRAYDLIYNEWFRDENLQSSSAFSTGDGPDSGFTGLLRRAKQHDYFTSCLPWPVKGGLEAPLPLLGNAPVTGIGASNTGISTEVAGISVYETQTGPLTYNAYFKASNAGYIAVKAQTPNAVVGSTNTPQVYANLSAVTLATINTIRLAFATQKVLERDARGGTRYTELLKAHFGVTPQDARVQRPEYIGGGKCSIQTSAVPQTSATGATGTTTVLGALGAAATAADQHSFSYHASEHGYIIGIAHVGADLTYQQGIRRHWSRFTRYDFYWPAFAFLGEQAVLNREIYADGSANDNNVFGYQERWAEYRHRPNQITGLFRSTSAGTIDPWHLAQKFTSVPALNATFISDTPPLSRALAAGAQANGMQILFDSVFKIKSTRPLPMFSVPGQLDRF